MCWCQQFLPRIWSTDKTLFGHSRYHASVKPPWQLWTRPILLLIRICNPFKLRYCRLTEESINVLPRLYVNSKLVDWMPLSTRVIFAYDLHVSNIKARAFKDHLLVFILVEWLVDNKSTTSAPPFVWSYIVCTCSFFLWSLVTFTFLCMVDKIITFFFSAR